MQCPLWGQDSVAADSLDIQRHRVFVQKWDYMIFSKLAILAGDAKSANLPTLVKNKQLICGIFRDLSGDLTFQVLKR
jgi:hypothetical protein